MCSMDTFTVSFLWCLPRKNYAGINVYPFRNKFLFVRSFLVFFSFSFINQIVIGTHFVQKKESENMSIDVE